MDCKVKRKYYAKAQGKRVVSLVVVKCNFVGEYVRPPEPIVPPILNQWINETNQTWLDENNNQWEA